MRARTLSLVGFVLPIVLAGAPGVGRASAQRQGINDVHALILAVEQLPQFSQDAVERLFGVQLKGDPRFPGPTDPRARIAEGLFSEVKFSEVRPQGAATSWHITVAVRRTVAVPIDSIDRQFIGRKLRGATDGPYGSRGTYSLDRPGMLLHLRYGMSSRMLEDLLFVRAGSPERSAWETRMARARTAVAEMGTLVRKIAAAPKISRAFVEGTFGVPLVASKQDGTDGRTWEASPGRPGVVAKVVYRELQAVRGVTSQILTLEIRSDVSIPDRLVDPGVLEGRAGLRVGAEADDADELRKITFIQQAVADH